LLVRLAVVRLQVEGAVHALALPVRVAASDDSCEFVAADGKPERVRHLVHGDGLGGRVAGHHQHPALRVLGAGTMLALALLNVLQDALGAADRGALHRTAGRYQRGPRGARLGPGVLHVDDGKVPARACARTHDERCDGLGRQARHFAVGFHHVAHEWRQRIERVRAVGVGGLRVFSVHAIPSAQRATSFRSS
jgi:hypothetical protein